MQASSTTDIYWFARAFASLWGGYLADQSTYRIGAGSTGLRILRDSAWAMLVAHISLAYYETLSYQNSNCIATFLYLTGAGLTGAATGVVWTILPLLITAVTWNRKSSKFGCMMGNLTSGPAIGIVFFYMFVSQQTDILGLVWVQTGCCLVVTLWLSKHYADVVAETSGGPLRQGDQQPLIGRDLEASTPKSV
eukprot:FR744042.1.p1 GENE.FR744042.1~~FR744042.1.p1  ORF type:complete len:223 (+),score=6.67 FR744042.1:92-670(+)